MKRIIREIVNNVLWGIKAGFKSNLNFEHPFERKNMFNLKRSKSKFSATLMSLTLLVRLSLAGAWSAAKIRFARWRGNRSQNPQFREDPMFFIMMKKFVAPLVGRNPAGVWSAAKMQAMLLAFFLSVFALGGSLTAALGAEMVWDRTLRKMVEAPRYGGTLTFANNNEPPNSDPSIGGLDAGFAISGVLEKLSIADWAIDRRVNDLGNEFLADDHLAPALAAGWENPDPLTYIFHIRQGVHWHKKAPMNGRELTAQDVEYNYHRLTGTGSFSEPPGHFSQLAALEYESIRATGKDTVVIKLKKPRLDALRVLVEDPYAFMAPPELIKQHGGTADWRKLVGTGPLELTDWVEGASLTWTKNPNYWGVDEKFPQNRLPYIDTLRGLVMPDESSRVAAMRSGKVDYIGHQARSALKVPDQVESLQRTNLDLKVYPYYFRSNASMAYDLTMPPFNDIRVRKALQLALDLEIVQKTFYKGKAIATPQGPVGNFQTQFSIHYDQWPEEIKAGYRYDPEAAEKLLDEAGYPRGADGIRLTTAMDGAKHNGFILDYWAIVQEYWRKIGVKGEVKVHEVTDWVARAQGHKFEGMTWTVSATPYHPLSILEAYYPGTTWNRGQTNDPKFNALYDAMKAATSVEELGKYSKEADLYVVAQHWALWGPVEPSYNFAQPWVKGYNGEFYMGVWNKNAAYVRFWIDQELKKQMGF